MVVLMSMMKRMLVEIFMLMVMIDGDGKEDHGIFPNHAYKIQK